MLIKRIIFDLDGTLINWKSQYLEAFHQAITDFNLNLDYRRQDEFTSTYEKIYSSFNLDDFQKHFYNVYHLEVPKEFFLSWINYLGNMSEKDPKLIALLDDLVKCYELVVLTNWFRSSQCERLKTAGIYKYFTKVVGGDEFTKPNPQSYFEAMENRKPEECLMVGDSYEIDIKGALQLGMSAVLVSKEKQDYDIPQIHNIYELKKVLKRIETHQ